jgi:hypothetical protein
MRKAKREITGQAELEAILKSSGVMRLGLAVDNVPYVVPLNFGYHDGRIYFHCATEGRKLDMIAKNDLVCFEVEGSYNLITADKPCGWTSRYRSVIGWGRASVVEDPKERLAGFKILMRHVSGQDYHDADFPAEHADKALIVRIDIEHMTGKKHHWDEQ